MRSRPEFYPLIAALVLCVPALSLADRPSRWTVVELTADVPAGGMARGVDNRGDVIGQTFTGSGFSIVSHAFVWQNGVRTALPGGTSSIAWAVNQNGTIAGSIDGIASMWKDGEPVSLQVVGQARAINDGGDIVGQYWTGGSVGSGNDWPFLDRDGVVYGLPTLGGSESAAVGVNGAGVAVGYSGVGNTSVTHAVAWSDGAIRDLGTLGGRQSFADVINDQGDIVGRAQDGAGRMFMVRWHADGSPVETLLEGGVPTGINNRGDIVGSSQISGEGFLYSDGAVTTLRDLPAMRAAGWQTFTPWGISERNWIVGTAWKPGAPFWGTAILLIPK